MKKKIQVAQREQKYKCSEKYGKMFCFAHNKKLQIKNTLRSHFSHIVLANIQKFGNTLCGWKWIKHSPILVMEMQNVRTTLEGNLIITSNIFAFVLWPSNTTSKNISQRYTEKNMKNKMMCKRLFMVAIHEK